MEQRQVDDLVMLVQRLARQLIKVDPNNELALAGLDYLKRNNLGANPLRHQGALSQMQDESKKLSKEQHNDT